MTLTVLVQASPRTFTTVCIPAAPLLAPLLAAARAEHPPGPLPPGVLGALKAGLPLTSYGYYNGDKTGNLHGAPANAGDVRPRPPARPYVPGQRLLSCTMRVWRASLHSDVGWGRAALRALHVLRLRRGHCGDRARCADGRDPGPLRRHRLRQRSATILPRAQIMNFFNSVCAAGG